MVSTLDFESSDPSSNLGGTCRRSMFFLDMFYFSSFRLVLYNSVEIPIRRSHFFSSNKRNYKRFSFLLQLGISSFKIKREKESRGNLPTSFSYLRRRLPENFCDWSLLVLFLIRELVFCKFSPLLFILKLSILQKHQHSLPFSRRAQCLLKPGHEKKNIRKTNI